MYTGILPEGRLIDTYENKRFLENISSLKQAWHLNKTIEGIVIKCDIFQNLTVSLGKFTGTISRDEAIATSAGKNFREISVISTVGKAICFKIVSISGPESDPNITLSRRLAQEEALNYLKTNLSPGDIIPGTVTHLEHFGAFVDIGCGITSMIGIDNISIARIPHTNARFYPDQQIYAVVTDVDQNTGRINLSHRELLGTWEENAQKFNIGETVCGIVRSVKPYGLFIELAPNFSGLSEPANGINEGDSVSVYIKSISPERMKLKLMIIRKLPNIETPPKYEYFITSGHISHWKYSPDNCSKIVESTFD